VADFVRQDYAQQLFAQPTPIAIGTRERESIDEVIEQPQVAFDGSRA
jgi:hypothetical protein